MYIGYIIKFWELYDHALLLSVLLQFLIAAKKEGEGIGVHGQMSLRNLKIFCRCFVTGINE